MVFEPRVYIKDESADPLYKVVNTRFLLASKILPVFLLVSSGVILLTQVVVPLLYFKTADNVSKPVSSSVLGVASGFKEFEFSELSSSNTTSPSEFYAPSYFAITIPKLDIEEALVEINATTLDPTLALGHYNGSALPGEMGNAFIYGHSVLPWFYNPKNYKTIFSTLDKLLMGDVLYITYNGSILEYVVDGTAILAPEDVNPLALAKPKFLNESTVTLMTCVPPGTKLKRLLVYAVLR